MGLHSPHLSENRTRLSVHITGTTKRSVTSLKPIWPFTLPDLSEAIEKELNERLPPGADGKIIELSSPTSLAR